MTGSSPFRILMVCTGNICRSPQAAQLLQSRVSAEGELLSAQVEIASAGTRAVVDAEMDPSAAELSRELGGTPTFHSARQLTSPMVAEADLVLCMSREHRSTTVRLMPRASRYTFLLTEFAGLLEDSARNQPVDGRSLGSAADSLPEELRRGVRAAAGRRGQAPRRSLCRAEIVDPHQAAVAVYRESAAQIHQAVERICQATSEIAESRS